MGSIVSELWSLRDGAEDRTIAVSGEVINTGTTQQPKCGDVELSGCLTRVAN